MKIDINQIEGYAYGAVQPSITLRFLEDTIDVQKHEAGFKKILDQLPRFEDDHRFFTGDEAIEHATPQALFVTILDTLNHFCGDQRFTPIRVFEEDRSQCFSLPTLSTAMSRFNMNAIQALLKLANKGALGKELAGFLEKQKRLARQFLPAGTNAGNFIAAAAERKIPFKIFNGRHIIFGYGSGSRIFNSSLTDEESAIGVQLAKSKVDTNRLLKMSGIPVAEQARVRTIDDAIRFAEKIGYPVVLKPEAEEQSRGVYANIIDESELKECWKLLSTSSYTSILIEKHVPGHIYRINTIDGEVARVVRRNPPVVVGDGVSTIDELISEINKEPLRTDPNSSVSMIIVDEDVVRSLAHQSLTTSSVLEKERTCYISSSCRNDTTTDFLDDFHPDNRKLCEKISRIMRLNVTGIDVIAVGASQSWRDGNFVICEVNSQPQLGVSHMHIYDDFITQKIKVKPFIRLIVSSASPDENSLFDPIYDNMEVKTSPEIALRQGCPVQYFNELEISDDVPDEERKKIKRMFVSVQPELG
ncbi:MAG: acetate--CoA ligase family protein [Marivita sp.]|uniref:acetate--CoA ligase family protein n=1 Tax=Marivita sp. TaxID=2003365 RepID=UPI003EFAFA28